MYHKKGDPPNVGTESPKITKTGLFMALNTAHTLYLHWQGLLTAECKENFSHKDFSFGNFISKDI